METRHRMRSYLVKATPDMSLREAIDMMELYQTPALPVVDDDDRLIGILTERDLVGRLAPQGWAEDGCGSGPETADSLDVASCMTTGVQTAGESADLAEVGRRMIAGRIKRLPVIDDEGRLVGILTRGDILQAIVEGDLS